jgi:phosphoglycolate phosphatase
MRRYDAVLFDFDGTVADTGEGILNSLRFAFLDQGDPVPDLSDLRKFIGPPIYYSFTAFYGVPEERVADYIKSYRARYRQTGVYECVLYPGMRETLQALRRHGVKVGIASSKPESLIYEVMRHLAVTELFDAVTGTAVDDSRHASKTELIEDCLAKLGVTDRTRALMVADRLYDLDGAAGAGVDGCGALFGYGSEAEFRAHNAKFMIAQPPALLPIVFGDKYAD